METTILRGAELVNHFNAAIAAGHSVLVYTVWKGARVTPKTAARWAEIGRPIFKASGDGRFALMAEGKRYVDIGGCGWRIE